MIPVRIQTLIVTAAPAPSIIVLQPVEETQNGKSRVVPIWIGAAEAAQMGVALEKARFTRPMTHDLFLDALTNLDARVDHVVINDVKGPTFFARLSAAPRGAPHRTGRADRPTRFRWPCVRKPPSTSRTTCWNGLHSHTCSRRLRTKRGARGVSHVLGGTGAEDFQE